MEISVREFVFVILGYRYLRNDIFFIEENLGQIWKNSHVIILYKGYCYLVYY